MIERLKAIGVKGGDKSSRVANWEYEGRVYSERLEDHLS